MRSLIGPAVMLLLSGCAGQPASEKLPCPEQRPQVCTMEYNPACGVLADGQRKEYSSPCNACADDQVVDVLQGPCTE